jgi:molybdenum cofactor cytidylyltransferase
VPAEQPSAKDAARSHAPQGARVSAILLAAGRSRRMGTQKALLPWGGGTLLDFQLDQLSSIPAISEIIVVTGFNAEAFAPAIARAPLARIAHNAAFDDGKASSVRTGATAVGADARAVLLLAVDQPRPSPLLGLLVDAHVSGAHAISAPMFEDHRGHPLMFDAALLPELRAVDEATFGVRAVIERHASDVHDIVVHDPIARIDVNTPEQAAEARRLLGMPVASPE